MYTYWDSESLGHRWGIAPILHPGPLQAAAMPGVGQGERPTMARGRPRVGAGVLGPRLTTALGTYIY